MHFQNNSKLIEYYNHLIDRVNYSLSISSNTMEAAKIVIKILKSGINFK